MAVYGAIGFLGPIAGALLIRAGLHSAFAYSLAALVIAALAFPFLRASSLSFGRWMLAVGAGVLAGLAAAALLGVAV